jgi:hypothetical protein
MGDTLDQDVHALKQFLDKAWHYLASPSLSRFQRQEMRNQMRLTEEALRIALKKVAARDRALVPIFNVRHKLRSPPALRLLSFDG